MCTTVVIKWAERWNFSNTFRFDIQGIFEFEQRVMPSVIVSVGPKFSCIEHASLSKADELPLVWD